MTSLSDPVNAFSTMHCPSLAFAEVFEEIHIRMRSSYKDDVCCHRLRPEGRVMIERTADLGLDVRRSALRTMRKFPA